MLDRPPLGRQVAAAVAADAAARPVALAQRLAQAGQQELDRDPRPPEHDRLATGAQERQRPALGEGHRRPARAARRARAPAGRRAGRAARRPARRSGR